MDEKLGFLLNDDVTIAVSGEHGKVTGRAEYLDSPRQYLVEYKAADGRAVSNWFTDRQLTAAS